MSSMELIKKLRDSTGSGIVDCKRALSENNNDGIIHPPPPA